jgi:hypothetical protein
MILIEDRVIQVSSKSKRYRFEVDDIILDEFNVLLCHSFVSSLINSFSTTAAITPAPKEVATIIDSNSGANINPSATQKPRQGAQLNGLKLIPRS